MVDHNVPGGALVTDLLRYQDLSGPAVAPPAICAAAQIEVWVVDANGKPPVTDAGQEPVIQSIESGRRLFHGAVDQAGHFVVTLCQGMSYKIFALLPKEQIYSAPVEVIPVTDNPALNLRLDKTPDEFQNLTGIDK